MQIKTTYTINCPKGHSINNSAPLHDIQVHIKQKGQYWPNVDNLAEFLTASLAVVVFSNNYLTKVFILKMHITLLARNFRSWKMYMYETFIFIQQFFLTIFKINIPLIKFTILDSKCNFLKIYFSFHYLSRIDENLHLLLLN